MRVAFCRHIIVVCGAISEPLGEGDGGYLTQGGESVLIDHIGVGWVCTIVNALVVHWMQCVFNKCTS